MGRMSHMASNSANNMKCIGEWCIGYVLSLMPVLWLSFPLDVLSNLTVVLKHRCNANAMQ